MSSLNLEARKRIILLEIHCYLRVYVCVCVCRCEFGELEHHIKNKLGSVVRTNSMKATFELMAPKKVSLIEVPNESHGVAMLFLIGSTYKTFFHFKNCRLTLTMPKLHTLDILYPRPSKVYGLYGKCENTSHLSCKSLN